MQQLSSHKIVLLMLFIYLFDITNGLEIVFNLPAKLTINKEHSVILTVFHAEVAEHLNVSVAVKNQVNNRKVFATQTTFIAATPVHTYHLSVRTSPLPLEWTFPEPQDDVMCLNTIEVSVTSTGGLSWAQQKVVPVVKKRGHIFIHTDRPVYRPGDEVFIRFIPVDEDLFPLDSSMSMSILAPNPRIGGDPLLSWNKKKSASNSVFMRTFRLPETPPLGQWLVNAAFYSQDIANDDFSTSFYVQEFTSSSFELTIEPARESFILPGDEDFSIVIHANFTYGEAVDGTAHVRFGLFVPGQENMLKSTHIIPQTSIRQGSVNVNVPMSNLTDGVPLLRLIEANTRLFIEASVTEQGGGRTRSIRNSDVIFTSSPLMLNLDRTAKYYKPGLLFTIQASGVYANGVPAPNVDLTVTVMASWADGRTNQIYQEIIPTCSEGTMLARFVAPTNTNSMVITMSGEYISSRGRRFPAVVQKEVLTQISSYGEYLQIVLPRKEFPVNVLASVEVHITPTPVAKTVVYTITSGKNFLLEGKKNAEPDANQVIITFPVSTEMSPIAHMTAYYVTQSLSDVSFIVADSSVLQVEEACRGIEPNADAVIRGDTLPFAGDRLDVEVYGEPRSVVGITGIDSSALSLLSEYSSEFGEGALNSRSKAFDILRSFSPGCKVPSTPFSESAFPAIGRALITSVSHHFHEASTSRCEEPAPGRERNKRNVYSSSLSMIDKADRIFGLAYECCTIGSNDVSSVMTYNGDVCQQRAATITLGNDCKEAFLECCREAECIRNNPERTARPCISALDRLRTVNANSSPVTGFSVVEKPVQLLRKNFAHTWFNADFRLGDEGHVVLNNNSNPRIPKLPDSITSWSIQAFTLSPERGMCISEPRTFEVEHLLFLEVNVPYIPVVRGKQLSIEVTVFSYLETEVEATVILEAEQNLCAGAQPGHDSDPIRRTLLPARNGVAKTVVVRFNVIPIQAGDYDIKVKLLGYHGNNEQPRIDKVIKTLHVIPEGTTQQRVEWILIDNRQVSRFSGSSPSIPTTQPFNLSLPDDAVPGTEQADITVHSITTAFLREPLMDESDGAMDTIAQYLYRLQAIITELEVATVPPSAAYLIEITSKAQTAYNGLLTFARDMRSLSGGNERALKADSLYGFSFSPAHVSKPDLWLTCATLRTICRVAELVELEPDRNILRGSLRWILSHQAPGIKGYFSNTVVQTNSRRKRSSCSGFKKSKRSSCRKGRNHNMPHQKFKEWRKRCRQRRRRCRRRRNTDKISQKLPHFNNNLDRKIYRTAVVTSFLASIYDSTDPRKTVNRRPQAFGAINTRKLRTALIFAVKYIREQTKRNRSPNASPITSAATGRAFYMVRGKVLKEVVDAVESYKHDEGEMSWIKTGDELTSLTGTQDLQVQSADVEATAYFLHLSLLTKKPGDNLASWLLQQRHINGRWVSLRDTLAAMDALACYVKKNLPTLTSTNFMRISVSSPSMPSPHSMSPLSNSSGGKRARTMSLPISNNAFEMTTEGLGKAWVEVDVRYNVLTPNKVVSRLSASPTAGTTTPILCPYDVSISMNRAAIPTTFILVRSSALSESLWNISLSVSFKPSYDPTESEDSTYVVDFGLHSDYKVIPEDLEMLSNPIEKAVDHYRISQRGLLLYMSGERNISFKIKDKQVSGNLHAIPVTVYPAAFPERRCSYFYSPPGASGIIGILCSGGSTRNSRDVCLCASARSCPKIIGRAKSVQTTTEARIRLSCNPSTKFAYRLKIDSVNESGSEWHVYRGLIQSVFKKSVELQTVSSTQMHTFWLRSTCATQKVQVDREYLVIGRSAVEGPNGTFKHLFDSYSRIEQWPGKKNNCARISNPQVNTICRKMNDYAYTMRETGCPS